MTSEDNRKQLVCKNVLIPVPEKYGKVISAHRKSQKLTQKEVSDRLSMRGRSAISEYENEITLITAHAWTLMAVALSFHPNLPKGVYYERPLVFETSPEPLEGFSEFITTARAKRKLSKKELSKKSNISEGKLNQIIKGSVKPSAREWISLQLALGEYAYGENIPKILKKERMRRDWSQADIASIVGLNAQSISNYETGKSIPGNHVWALLMLAYDVHPNYRLLKREIDFDIDNYLYEHLDFKD